MVEFKRGVYEMALTELARFLPRQEQRNRYLRSGMRNREDGAAAPVTALPSRTTLGLLHPGLELPPGASFDPDPQTDLTAASQRAASGNNKHL
ncbi:hypothetical protein D3C86_1736430 [compost metagenome]